MGRFKFDCRLSSVFAKVMASVQNRGFSSEIAGFRGKTLETADHLHIAELLEGKVQTVGTDGPRNLTQKEVGFLRELQGIDKKEVAKARRMKVPIPTQAAKHVLHPVSNGSPPTTSTVAESGTPAHVFEQVHDVLVDRQRMQIAVLGSEVARLRSNAACGASARSLKETHANKALVSDVIITLFKNTLPDVPDLDAKIKDWVEGMFSHVGITQ